MCQLKTASTGQGDKNGKGLGNAIARDGADFEVDAPEEHKCHVTALRFKEADPAPDVQRARQRFPRCL